MPRTCLEHRRTGVASGVQRVRSRRQQTVSHLQKRWSAPRAAERSRYLPKLNTGVRFPSPALRTATIPASAAAEARFRPQTFKKATVRPDAPLKHRHGHGCPAGAALHVDLRPIGGVHPASGPERTVGDQHTSLRRPTLGIPSQARHCRHTWSVLNYGVVDASMLLRTSSMSSAFTWPTRS